MICRKFSYLENLIIMNNMKFLLGVGWIFSLPNLSHDLVADSLRKSPSYYNLWIIRSAR